MKPTLKKLSEQVVVITGATSGIGLATARLAAKRGARLVLVARNSDALKQIAARFAGQGHEALPVTADVGDELALRRVCQEAISRFGGFDTWINNAGITIFGRLDQVSVEDQRRLFDTNFWGVVFGSRIAVEHLKQRGGALINVGSEVSDRAIPLQGIYSASKHAVKGYTDALRMELEQQGAPVSVTLIKPAAVDSLYVAHAKNYMDVEPKLPPPVYAPEVVARAILHAAEHPRRDIFVGGAAKFFSASAHYAPRLLDRYMRRFLFTQQRTERPKESERNSLHTPGSDLRERQGAPGRVLESSLYTRAATHPKTALALLMGTALALRAVLASRPAGSAALNR